MKIKVQEQPNPSACGPTCIQMVTEYFNTPVSYSKITKLVHFDRKEGMSDIEIVKGLKDLGYKVSSKKNVSWEELQKLNTEENALIVSWMMDGYKGHVSLVEKVTDTHITLADPDKGKYVKMPKIQFLRLWMSYDDLWFPEKNTDINLRWIAVVSKN